MNFLEGEEMKEEITLTYKVSLKDTMDEIKELSAVCQVCGHEAKIKSLKTKHYCLKCKPEKVLIYLPEDYEYLKTYIWGINKCD